MPPLLSQIVVKIAEIVPAQAIRDPAILHQLDMLAITAAGKVII